MASQPALPATLLRLQGALNIAFGLYGIIRPAEMIVQLTDRFGGTIPTPIVYISGLHLLSMGFLTFFAASQPSLHRQALMARILVHLLSGYLLWGGETKMKSVPITEIVFSFLNVLAVPFASKSGAL